MSAVSVFYIFLNFLFSVAVTNILPKSMFSVSLDIKTGHLSATLFPANYTDGTQETKPNTTKQTCRNNGKAAENAKTEARFGHHVRCPAT